MSVADDTPSILVLARKVALAFYLAAREEKAGLIGMRAMGLDGEPRQRLAAVDATSTIAGSVGRNLLGGFGQSRRWFLAFVFQQRDNAI